MKYNSLSLCVLSLFSGATLLCGCNTNPLTAMVLEVSDVPQEGPDRCTNSDGGLGRVGVSVEVNVGVVVVNDAWLVQEGFRQGQDGEHSSSVDLQLVKQDLQSAEENSGKYRTLLHECETVRQLSDGRRERRFEERRSTSTATQEYFESEIADLKSQLVSLKKIILHT
jgi:hypothetical protein